MNKNENPYNGKYNSKLNAHKSQLKLKESDCWEKSSVGLQSRKGHKHNKSMSDTPDDKYEVSS